MAVGFLDFFILSPFLFMKSLFARPIMALVVIFIILIVLSFILVSVTFVHLIELVVYPLIISVCFGVVSKSRALRDGTARLFVMIVRLEFFALLIHLVFLLPVIVLLIISLIVLVSVEITQTLAVLLTVVKPIAVRQRVCGRKVSIIAFHLALPRIITLLAWLIFIVVVILLI